MLDLLGQVTSTNVTSTDDLSGGWLVFVWVASLLVAILIIVAMWKIFEKAGEAGWKSIIPLYNTWVLFEIAGKPGWWLILALIPFVNIVVAIILALELAKRFGKSGLFGIIGLFLFAPIGHLILGFGSAKYDGKKYKG